MNNKPIAVIILNWNGENLLREYLRSVVMDSRNDLADIIVADNGSTDNSIEFLKTNFPDVKIIEFKENYGYAEGYNRAIAATDYEYTVLLNSDVLVPNNWLAPLYDYCQEHPNVGAVQPKILSQSNRSQFEYAGACGGYLDKLGFPYCRGRIFSTIEEDEGQYDSIENIFWASGAALFVRTEVYKKAGGLDKEFFAHMEEIDLCWRIHLLGFEVKVIPDSWVFHLGGGSLPASNPRKTYLNFRNNLLLLHKNLPDSVRGKVLFKRRLYDALAYFMFLFKLDFPNANAILNAHKDFKKMRRNYKVFPSKNLLEILPGCERNIIIDYFLKGKKKF